MEGRTVNDIVAEMLEESGVYVVLSPRFGSEYDEVIGVAATLTGAMRLVLSTGELETWIGINDPEDPEAGEMVTVTPDTPGVTDLFKWVADDGFELGSGWMRAEFDGQASRFIVQWRQMAF